MVEIHEATARRVTNRWKTRTKWKTSRHPWLRMFPPLQWWTLTPPLFPPLLGRNRWRVATWQRHRHLSLPHIALYLALPFRSGSGGAATCTTCSGISARQPDGHPICAGFNRGCGPHQSDLWAKWPRCARVAATCFIFSKGQSCPQRKAETEEERGQVEEAEGQGVDLQLDAALGCFRQIVRQS